MSAALHCPGFDSVIKSSDVFTKSWESGLGEPCILARRLVTLTLSWVSRAPLQHCLAKGPWLAEARPQFSCVLKLSQGSCSGSSQSYQ